MSASRREVLAVRYAEWPITRSRVFHHYAAYGEPDADVRLTYYFWVIRDARGVTLIDTGFDPRSLESRPGRNLFIAPLEALARLGIDPAEVGTIVITHFHYDHIGNVKSFPNARLLLQRKELDFWLGPYGGLPPLAGEIERRELATIAKLVDAGRVTVLDGARPPADGIELIWVGGHSPGLQMVVVEGDREIVLAADVLHFYEELEREMAFSSYLDLQRMYEGYALLRERRDAGATIVAGHDPEVMDRFERLSVDGEELGVRITG